MDCYSEKKLLVALLCRAVIDITDPDTSCFDDKGGWLADAYRWISADESNPFTFKWVCEHLELDPDRLRNHLLKRSTIGIYSIANRHGMDGLLNQIFDDTPDEYPLRVALPVGW